MQLKIYSDIPKEFRHEWEMLWLQHPRRNFFNHPDWTKAWRLANPDTVLHIYAVYTGKRLTAVLPLVKSVKFGIPVFRCPGGDYLDISCLLAPLNNHRVTNFLIRSVIKETPLYLAEVTQLLNYPSIVTTPRPLSGSPFLDLLPDPFRFLNRHHRKEIRSAMNKMNGTLEFQFISPVSLADLDKVIALEHRSSKASRSMETFSSSRAIRLISAIIAASPDRMAIALLCLNGTPVAADMGYLCGAVFHNFYTVYDQEFAVLSPGRVLKYKLIEYLFLHQYTTIDFSRGISRYKRDFSPDFTLHYDQFISDKLPIRIYWQMISGLFLFLEKHRWVYNHIRIIKNHIFNSKTWLYIKLLLQTPKIFLFNFFSRDLQPVVLRPFNPRSRLVADRLLARINAVSPDIKAHLIGSTLFGIPGNGDIDIFIEGGFPAAKKYLPQLSDIIGPPKKIRDRFVEWQTQIDNIITEVTLIDSQEARFKEQMKIKDTLVNNPVLMKEYLSLKQTLSGRTNRDYQLMRMDFFNRILKLK